ncbi:hypothetical protein H920_15549 [Fukomys damarensis]|uniref:Uncharacterized protein n=1 Tax=Fukomys damarensis TaxID=885580 RepID=A0A091CWL4_FUKDA|nr:hypothetical protein H920_15549 [Fukomys damarensis]
MLTNPNPNPSPQPDSSIAVGHHLKSSPVLKPQGVEWGACAVPFIELSPYSLARHYPLERRCNVRVLVNAQCIPPS